jgi:hypothetical protein
LPSTWGLSFTASIPTVVPSFPTPQCPPNAGPSASATVGALALAAYPGGDGEGDVPGGEGLVVPLATGVGDGEGLTVAVGEGLEVLVGLGVGFVVFVAEGVLRDDVVAVIWVEPPTPGAVLLDGVEVAGDGRRVVVGVGVFCTVEGPPDSPEPFSRRATTSVPMTTAATSPTSAIIGSDTDRARPPRVRPPVPGSPRIGSGAVGGRWYPAG